MNFQSVKAKSLFKRFSFLSFFVFAFLIISSKHVYAGTIPQIFEVPSFTNNYQYNCIIKTENLSTTYIQYNVLSSNFPMVADNDYIYIKGTTWVNQLRDDKTNWGYASIMNYSDTTYITQLAFNNNTTFHTTVYFTDHAIKQFDGNVIASPPFTGSANYNLVKSGDYEGLKITNPYNNVTVKTPVVNIIAHARIHTTADYHDYIKDVVSLFGVALSDNTKARQSLISKIQSSTQVFINNTFVDVVPSVTLGNVENDYYNATITYPVTLDDPTNSIVMHSTFINGLEVQIGNTISYSDTLIVNYTKFTSVVTTSVSADGKTTTTTTTKANGINDVHSVTKNDDHSVITVDSNDDGTTKTTTVDPNGVETVVDNNTVIPPVVLPVDSDGSPNAIGFFGSLLKLFNSIIKVLLTPLTLVVNILNTLVSSIGTMMTSMGDVVPFLTRIFSFLPSQVVALITACFSFLAIGVFLRTFGRK